MVQKDVKKTKNDRVSRSEKSAKNDSWMKKLEEKLEGKLDKALFLLIIICVFGGAGIGQIKCKKGFRNA